MGCIPTHNKPYNKSDQQLAMNQFKQYLKPIQFQNLTYIYQDLATRTSETKVNQENFLLFFHKNGFWGQRLFQQFDSDDSKLICMQQFIKGIVKIFKTTEKQKIRLLFSFFTKGINKGITFNDLVVVLYNYPKSDLKQIFDDEYFLEDEVKKKILEIKKSRNKVQGPESGQFSTYKIQDSDGQSELPIPSGYGFKGVLEEVNQRRKNQQKTSINIKMGQKHVIIKTSNIQHMVRKFARKIFHSYQIDQTTGTLTELQFSNWIQGHKNLYNNYYDGFHNEIWEINNTTQKPKYITCNFERDSQAKMNIQNTLQNVHLYLLNSTIIVTNENQRQKPICIICLQGLAVKKCYQKTQGFCLQISHRDGQYRTKKIFLKNQQSASKWMESLKYYKGTSIQQHYQMGHKIGTGKFSVVYEAKQTKTNIKYAIKVIQSSKLDAQARHLIAHQSIIMGILNHPLLVSFKQSVQTKTHLYIVTQLVQGKDLFEFVRTNKNLNEIDAAKIIRQIIIGVKYLHDIGIIHRDLKPQNIMIVTNSKTNKAQSIKIIDFGFSNYATSLKQCDPTELLAGTPGYIAPEILKNQIITEQIDNFAIGTIMFFILSGHVAFHGNNIHEILHKTLEGAYNYDGKVWRMISMEAKDLIDKLLLENPLHRISLENALRHSWFFKTNQQNCKIVKH